MVIDDGGVKLLSKYLDSHSTQIRKYALAPIHIHFHIHIHMYVPVHVLNERYAVLVLAQLAISTKGQTNLLEENVLSKVSRVRSCRHQCVDSAQLTYRSAAC